MRVSFLQLVPKSGQFAKDLCISYIFIFLFFLAFDLQDMELLVLSKLKWDVYCITPFDYVDLLLPRLTMGAHDQKRFYALVQSLIEVCCLGERAQPVACLLPFTNRNGMNGYKL